MAMESSSSRSLELKLMNCKGLQAFNFFQKLSVYALVSLISDDRTKKPHPHQQQQQRTVTDTEGDKNPEWNHEMRFDLEDADHLFLRVDLRSELAVFGDKSLGEVRVLLKDLIINEKVNEQEFSSTSSNGITRFVSYEVRTSDNKPNGVLTFSFKVLMSKIHGVASSSNTATASETNNYGQIDGYTVVNHVDNNVLHQHHHQNDQNWTNYFPSSSYMQSADEILPNRPYGASYQEGSASAYYSMAESKPDYPSLETPSAGEGYISYPQIDHDQFQYPPSNPPPLPQPFHEPLNLPLLSPPPFPPPPPPLPYPPPPHHHHHHHHYHVAQGAVYPPPSPWDVYGHSHSMPSNIYYNGDGTNRI